MADPARPLTPARNNTLPIINSPQPHDVCRPCSRCKLVRLHQRQLLFPIFLIGPAARGQIRVHGDARVAHTPHFMARELKAECCARSGLWALARALPCSCVTLVSAGNYCLAVADLLLRGLQFQQITLGGTGCFADSPPDHNLMSVISRQPPYGRA